MKKRLLSLVLCLVMVFSLFPVFGMSAAAASDPVLISQKTGNDVGNALHMRKSLYKNEDGTYDIVIENWATGTVESHTVTEAVPTDFVLILDQSGSMDTADMPAAYKAVAGPWTPSKVMNYNQTLYYKVTNTDGTVSYYQVGCKDVPTSGLTKISPKVRDFGRNTGTRITAKINNNNVYAMDSSGAIYQVYRDTTAFLIYHNSEFYYYDAYGNRQTVDSQAWWGAWDLATNPRLSATNLYTMSGNNHGYGLYYKDDTGVEHQVADSQTVSAAGTTFYSGELYTTNGQNQTRLEALKDAVSGFVSTVQSKAEEDDVNHRIAIVGFASDGTNYNDSAWENTELLTGVNVSGKNGRLYNRISDTDYKNALQDVTTSAGRTDLNNAVNAIDSEGGTQAQYGFYMAENILEKREVTTYVNQAEETADRNTVVLFFTDGHPGNYDTDDTIAAANTVVDAAKAVKQNTWKTTVFSVGIFASGDDQPLTYALNTNNMSNSQQQAALQRDNYIRYSGNYLYFRGNKVTQSPHNDTIADYMTCVSSVYPAASNFLTHAGGTTDTGSLSNARGAENQDNVNYYMRVTDASGLQRAFETVANSIDTSSTSATVDSNAVLRDTVYTGDFDVSGASVEAKSVKVHMVDGQVIETGEAGTASPSVTESVRSNGRLSVTGFNYSELYTTATQSGEKLVVTIKNVEPKTGGHLYSNSGDASIFPGAESSNVVVSVASPDENIARVTHVIDFNAPMTLETGVKRMTRETANNGEFKKVGSDVTYKLKYDEGTIAGGTATVNGRYTGVDSAMIYGSETDPSAWTQVNTVPASSVYFDDDLANGDAIAIGDGSGYNSAVSVSPAKTEAERGTYTITFNGTGIDIYCTTDDGSGYIKAKLDDSVVTMKNHSETTRYNVPTISYSGLTYGQHTVTLTILSSSHYKLDGVRVYGPVENQELYNNTPAEKNAAYISMREALVNDNGVSQAFSDSMTDPVLGALFVDDRSKLTRYVSMTPEEIEAGDTPAKYVDAEGNDVEAGTEGAIPMKLLYADAFEAYKSNSPKNEIYLEKNQAIIFTLSEAAETAAKNGNLWIGLSAPDQNKNSGTVTLKEGKTINVTSGVDMYYPITADMLGANRVVTLTNSGDNMISVTNLKITGNEAIYNAAKTVKNTENTRSADKAMASVLSVEDVIPMVFEPMTLRSVKIAASNGVDPEAVVEPEVPETPAPTEEPEVTPDPTPTPEVTPEPTQAPSVHDIVKQIVSSFVSSLFRSISRLFGN